MGKIKNIEHHVYPHVHEFIGSTFSAELNATQHNHRFAGISSTAIPFGKTHIHEMISNTDSFDHFHRIRTFSGPAIPIGNKHVHYASGITSIIDNHYHHFIFATLIDNPTIPHKYR